jgi:hypothetical protein
VAWALDQGVSLACLAVMARASAAPRAADDILAARSADQGREAAGTLTVDGHVIEQGCCSGN